MGKYLTNIQSNVFYGGYPIDKDKEKLSKNPAIIVGTPGRILDLYKRKLLKFDQLRFFILDECDKMLEQKGKKKFLAKDINCVNYLKAKKKYIFNSRIVYSKEFLNFVGDSIHIFALKVFAKNSIFLQIDLKNSTKMAIFLYF